MRFVRRSRGAAPVAESRYYTGKSVATGYCNDSTFLLNKRTGRYYRLDEVGTELWTLLRRSPGLNAREIVQELSAVYEVPPQDIAGDVATLIATLVNYAVIDVATRHE